MGIFCANIYKSVIFCAYKYIYSSCLPVLWFAFIYAKRGKIIVRIIRKNRPPPFRVIHVAQSFGFVISFSRLLRLSVLRVNCLFVASVFIDFLAQAHYFSCCFARLPIGQPVRLLFYCIVLSCLVVSFKFFEQLLIIRRFTQPPHSDSAL